MIDKKFYPYILLISQGQLKTCVHTTESAETCGGSAIDLYTQRMDKILFTVGSVSHYLILDSVAHSLFRSFTAYCTCSLKLQCVIWLK